MTKATVFTNNKSQAVRLPKTVALPDSVKQVEVIKVGKARLITPADSRWDTFFDGPKASEDFRAERQQPPMPQREGW